MNPWNTDFDRRFNRMHRLVTWFIGGVVLAYKAATVAGEQDWSEGIKPVIERLWCGKPGCLGG